MDFIHKRARAGHILSQDEALLRWQFDPSRGGEQGDSGLSMLLAVTEKGIGGILGLIPFDLNVGGAVARGAWLSQMFSAPELRRYNVGLSLLWRVQRLHYDALFGLGLTEAAQRMSSALRFEQMTRIPRWIGVIDLGKTIDFLTDVSSQPGPFTKTEQLAEYVVTEPAPSRDMPIQLVAWDESMSEQWDRLWKSCLAPGLIGPARSSAFLRWRYVQHPESPYAIRLARNAETHELLGLAVFRTEATPGNQNRKVMRILELLAVPHAYPALATALVNEALQRKVVFADFFSTFVIAGNALERAGFRLHGENPGVPNFPRQLDPVNPSHSPLYGAFWLSKELRQKTGNLSDRNDFYITRQQECDAET